MQTETREKILEKIDDILAALGHRDREAFRATLRRGSVLLTNLASCSAMIAAMTDRDLEALIDRLQNVEQEQALRMLVNLQSYLPMFAKVLIDYAQRLPQSPGGRPPSFKDRQAVQVACNLVLELIAKGYAEAQAKRLAARKLNVSPQTINRTWKRRAELATEVDIPEFLGQLLRGLATPQPNQPIEGVGSRGAVSSTRSETLPEAKP